MMNFDEDTQTPTVTVKPDNAVDAYVRIYRIYCWNL